MSQQINLLLPELRPRFDWLGLPMVAGAAIAGLVLLFLIYEGGAFRLQALKSDEANINGQMLNLQQQVQSLGQTLGARQGNVALPPEIAGAKTGVAQRQAVLAFIGQGRTGQEGGFAAMLQGFARQSLDGVWLVGFGLAPNALEIRGRLLDPALLPVYINKLNADSAFVGRRFGALEMKGVDPQAEPRSDEKAVKPAGGRYTEFVLRTDLSVSPEKAR